MHILEEGVRQLKKIGQVKSGKGIKYQVLWDKKRGDVYAKDYGGLFGSWTSTGCPTRAKPASDAVRGAKAFIYNKKLSSSPSLLFSTSQ